jgi:hypothetical protein
MEVQMNDTLVLEKASVPTEEDRLLAIWDEDFMYVPELSTHLGLAINTVRKMINFDPIANRPRPGSEFPNAYKERPVQTARIRIPMSDIQEYKLRCLKGGSWHNLGEVKESQDDPT